MANGKFRGLISKDGVKYLPNELPSEIKDKLAKVIINYEKQKTAAKILQQNNLKIRREND